MLTVVLFKLSKNIILKFINQFNSLNLPIFIMVSEQEISNENSIPHNHNPISTPPSPTEIPLIALNITSQINDKLTPSTFLQWRAQFEALLIGYDLFDYVIEEKICPILTSTSTCGVQRTHWIKQDKLILSAILASTSAVITPLISMAKHKRMHDINYIHYMQASPEPE
jgi:hypothetical protein